LVLEAQRYRMCSCFVICSCCRWLRVQLLSRKFSRGVLKSLEMEPLAVVALPLDKHSRPREVGPLSVCFT
jgi:hypothetical protein